MIETELLKEKNRVQKELASKYKTVKDYIRQSSVAAGDVAKKYNILLNYVEIPNKIKWFCRFYNFKFF